MTARDRIVVLVIGALVILGAVWFELVSPQRSEASHLLSQVHSAQSSLSSAESQLAEAKAAEQRYSAAYASIVNLGEAVPADEQVPSLIYQVNHAAGKAKVSFESISVGGSSEAAVAAPSEAAAGASPAFAAVPFSFTFTGSYRELYRMMSKLQRFAVSGENGGAVKVSGRLLTIDSLSLSGGSGGSGAVGGSGSAAGAGAAQLTGTVSATAYVLPPGEALTAGATPAGPAGGATATTGTGASPAATPATVEAPR